MNVLFHVVAGLSIAIVLAKPKVPLARRQIFQSSLIGIFLGILSHGLLDIVPHCYPLRATWDASIASFCILFLLWKAKMPFKIVLGSSVFGAVLPDLIDLGPAILNKYIGLQVPIFSKFFPWHWPQFSGSIYSGDCIGSSINMALFLATLVFIYYANRAKLDALFH